MLSRLRARLTYANVMATLAVFIALGGSSYAALELPKKSVGSKHIKKSSVGSQHIKRNAVTSAKVKPGSLLMSDFKASQRQRLTGDPGSARAYGSVNIQTVNRREGGVGLNRSKNIVRVTNSSPGTFCVVLDPAAGIDMDYTVPVVTVDYNTSRNPAAVAYWGSVESGSPLCPGVAVFTKALTGGEGTFQNASFSIVIP
jgi:hypothetical protein